MRNNLLTGQAKFCWKSTDHGEQLASWSDIIELYEKDVGDADFRMLNKLTESHVYPAKMRKMKVSVATQVFSHHVSSTMRALAKFGKELMIFF